MYLKCLSSCHLVIACVVREYMESNFLRNLTNGRKTKHNLFLNFYFSPVVSRMQNNLRPGYLSEEDNSFLDEVKSKGFLDYVEGKK